MKKKIVISLILIISLIFFFLFRIIHSEYDFKYFKSSKGNYTVTRVIRTSILNYEVYYTYGKYKLKKIPKQYVRPKSVIGFDEGYDLIINWTDSICTIYTCYGNYETVGLNHLFRYKRKSCNLNDTAWSLMLNDTINNYFEISSKLPGANVGM